MSTFGGFGAATSSHATIGPNDHSVPQPGSDGVSSLCWSPTANHLVSSNWDNGVRCYEVVEQAGQIMANPKAQGTKKSSNRKSLR
jgi:mRNA export factor